jgi:hypothetical protein
MALGTTTEGLWDTLLVAIGARDDGLGATLGVAGTGCNNGLGLVVVTGADGLDIAGIGDTAGL